MTNLDVSLIIPFPTAREATIALEALKVDKEISKNATAGYSVEDSSLKVDIAGTDARKVRVEVTSVMESLLLVMRTLEKFGPPEPTYHHY